MKWISYITLIFPTFTTWSNQGLNFSGKFDLTVFKQFIVVKMAYNFF